MLQDDWCFELEVWDWNEIFSHTLIGTTQIDLELRRWSTQYSLTVLALRQQKDIADENIAELKAISCKIKNKAVLLKYWNSHKKRLADTINLMQSKGGIPPSQPEMRPLIHQDKPQAQGLVELYVDVLDAKELKHYSRKPPKEKVNEHDEYELRLIIWGTEGAECQDGKLTAEIRACYTPESLSGKMIEK